MNNHLKKQEGLSLIELMIAMLLGILLLLSVVSLFTTNRRIYKEQESMSQVQNNARYALETMIWDIRMAGYTGCAYDLSQVNNLLADGGDAKKIDSFINPVQGSESKSNWLPSDSQDQIDDDGVADMVPGSDGISVAFLDPTNIFLTSLMPDFISPLQVTSTGSLKVGDPIAVTDCASADILPLGGIGAGPTITHPESLSKRYGNTAQIASFVSRRYFIANNDDGVPSLYRLRNDATPTGSPPKLQPEELIEGVEQMQILYGQDNDADKVADIYFDATDVTDWSSVVSVRLSLLFRTLEQNFQIDKDDKTYNLLGGAGSGGATVGPVSDFNRRRIFTTTIQIRNRSS